MFRDQAKLFAYEAKRKPELADMLAHAGRLTDAEIEALRYPKWIRDHLRAERSRLEQARISAHAAAWLDRCAVHGMTPDPTGQTLRWTGDRRYVRLDRGSEIEIRTGTLIWLGDAEAGVWIRTSFSRHIDPALLAGSVPVGSMSKAAYTAFYKAEDEENTPSDVPVIMAQPGCEGPAARFGLRFFSIP